MALPQSNAYKGSSYGGKIATPRLDSRGANLQQQGIAEMNDKRLRDQFDARMDAMRRKEILQMQKNSAEQATKLYDKVDKVSSGGETYQQKANTYWNGQINEVVKIKSGMNKMPNEEGYIDPVVGARMISNISSSIDKYSTGINKAAAEAVIIDDALKNPIGEEGAISITNKNLPQAKLLQDWKNGVEGIDISSNDQGQTLLTRDNVVFNIDAYVDAQEDDVDMFLKVPEYKVPLSSTATSVLGGDSKTSEYSSKYYKYELQSDGQMKFGTLEPREDKMKELVADLAKNDATIIRMTNDPIYAKVYWKDVLKQKNDWTGSESQKEDMKLKLAQLSVDNAREVNGTSTARFATDPKIYSKGGNKGPKNKPNKSTVEIDYRPWIKKELVFNQVQASESTEVDDITGLPKEITVSEKSKNIEKVKKKLLEIYPNTMMTGANFLKQNPDGVGNQYQVALDATNVNPEDLIIKYLPNEDTQTVRYEKIDISDQKLRDENTVYALLNDPRGLTEGKASIL